MIRDIFPEEKYWKHLYFWNYLLKGFYLLLKFLHFIDSDTYDEATCISKRLYKLKPILGHLNDKFRSVYIPECDVSVDESLMLWKGCFSWKIYTPSKVL
jgi:hypothetical protein